jgi:hypothetical protein
VAAAETLRWIKPRSAILFDNVPPPSWSNWIGVVVMTDYGKRKTPVPAKPLSPEALARWRSRERERLSHEHEGHEHESREHEGHGQDGPENEGHEAAPPADAPDHAAGEGDHGRHADRHMTLIHGQVVFNDLMSTYDCTIRDLSETGAKLKLHAPVQVPKAFLLRFGDGQVRRCKVRRRNALELGVEFLDPET